MGVAIAPGGTSVILEDIRWTTFEVLVEDLRGGRMTYDGERLEIMSPSLRQEEVKGLLRRLIETWAEERSIDIKNLASLTIKRKDLVKGLEPDECFYVQHFLAVRGKDELDSRPPDMRCFVSVPRRPFDSLRSLRTTQEVWTGKAK